MRGASAGATGLQPLSAALPSSVDSSWKPPSKAEAQAFDAKKTKTLRRRDKTAKSAPQPKLTYREEYLHDNKCPSWEENYDSHDMHSE